MKSLMIFICMFFFLQAEAHSCDCLNKVHFLCILAEAELDQAYFKEVKDIAYYHGRVDAMGTAYFQIQQSVGLCQCVRIVTKLRDKAENQLDHVERYSHWAPDTWYWIGSLNAYYEIIEVLSANSTI